ncbi:cytochrome P450 [Colletotrichum navitas]|uniref:Cytochrome P450 n=1 Tax=Colletotrichum navitas TaxID=681940 RepID=A0AAD8V099_9PEZI|nr:cytochrome P450 [Colletotrichum navitas]KAK1573014.1 cytochrome P450 [Colletotrichum navitas]
MTYAIRLVAAAGALEAQTLQHWTAAAAGLVFVVFSLLAQRWLTADPLARVPVVGKGSRWARRRQFLQGKGHQLYIDGYKQFKDTIFRITTAMDNDTICVPPKFLSELKKAPDDVISFDKSIDETMQVRYTKIQNGSPILIHAIRASLTPALPWLNSSIAEEVAETMRLELPQSTGWSEVNMTSKLLRIIAMVSGRVFIGPELCRDERYINASINYTLDLVTAVHVIGLVPSFLRPLVATWLPTTRKLYRRDNEAEAIFRPIIASRRKAAEKGNDYQEPNDMLQWILNAQAKFGALSDLDLAKIQLSISFAAIHTTTLTTTNAVYWLAAKPELIPILRDDVQQALLQSGGEFTSGALQNMKKVDSFLKEVMRLSPLGAGAFQRKVLKSMKLPNGQTIPKGLFVEVPISGVNLDPEFFPDPEVFDALRFYKLREAKEHAASGTQAAEVVMQAQFVSVGATHLTFGYGKHACPGRFFAVNEIKMIMANLLRNYDIRLPDNVSERYKNLIFGASSIPDPNKTIMIRKAVI